MRRVVVSEGEDLTRFKSNELKGIRIYTIQVGTEYSVGNFFRIVDF